jgi:beta-lactamase regulating signal transducer with metallopeptidase domain
MIRTLMMCSVGVSALLVVAASLLQSQLTSGPFTRRTPVRWLWIGALGLTVVLTALLPFRQSVSVSLPAGEPSLPNAALHLVSTPAPMLDRALGMLWVVTSTVGLLTLCAMYLSNLRAVRRLPTTMLHGVQVRVSTQGGPAALGVGRAQIVVPEWLMGSSQAEQQLVLAHECEHARAFDPTMLLAGWILVALMPWNPLLWYAMSRLRLAVELDCDQRVLRRGASAKRYASLLLDVMTRRAEFGVVAPALSYSRSHLEHRVLSMRVRHRRGDGVRRTAAQLVALAFTVAACAATLPYTTVEQESSLPAVFEGAPTTESLFGFRRAAVRPDEMLFATPLLFRAELPPEAPGTRSTTAQRGRERDPEHDRERAAVNSSRDAR